MLSCTKNKLNDFNGLQSHTTGSIPVSPTISTKIKYIRNNKDLSCKLLKLLGYFYYPCLKRTYLILNTYLKNRSKLPPKIIKVSCKCLVKISRVHRDRARGSQVCVFFYLHYYAYSHIMFL